MENVPLVTGTFGLIFMIVWLVLLIFTMIHCVGNIHIDKNNKLLWIAIILVVPIGGSLVYLFWRTVKRVSN